MPGDGRRMNVRRRGALRTPGRVARQAWRRDDVSCMSRLTSLVPRSALLLAVVASFGGLGSAVLAGSTDALSATRPTASRVTAGFDTSAEAARAGMEKGVGHVLGKVLPQGSFTLTVPSHSVAAPDGVPEDLPRGSHVRMTALVWSAGGEEPGRATLSVTAPGQPCPVVELQAGAVVAVTCDTVAPAGSWLVRVVLVDGGGRSASVLRSWRHRVR